jgi:hypothetical protein
VTKDELKAITLRALEAIRGDDYTRAYAAWGSLTPEQMQEEYGRSGRTRAATLEEYRLCKEQTDAAIVWVKSLAVAAVLVFAMASPALAERVTPSTLAQSWYGWTGHEDGLLWTRTLTIARSTARALRLPPRARAIVLSLDAETYSALATVIDKAGVDICNLEGSFSAFDNCTRFQPVAGSCGILPQELSVSAGSTPCKALE